jgi:hypothetical protein
MTKLEYQIPFYRDQFLSSSRLRGLSRQTQMYWLDSMLVLTDPRYNVPTRGCLVVGTAAMTFDLCWRALDFTQGKRADPHWEALFRTGAFEYRSIGGVQYVHVYGFERNQMRERREQYEAQREVKVAMPDLTNQTKRNATVRNRDAARKIQQMAAAERGLLDERE